MVELIITLNSDCNKIIEQLKGQKKRRVPLYVRRYGERENVKHNTNMLMVIVTLIDFET